jgi:hypothetical protein
VVYFLFAPVVYFAVVRYFTNSALPFLKVLIEVAVGLLGHDFPLRSEWDVSQVEPADAAAGHALE